MSDASPLPTSMVWHIVKKDARLLWPLVLASVVGLAIVNTLIYRNAHFAFDFAYRFQTLTMFTCLAIGIALGLLITLVIQQEAIPSVNQDWLVRPIKRRDLLLAKVLTVLLLIHLPMLAITSLRVLAEGFSFGESLSAALLSNLEVALVFTLPLMAIAAVTKNVTEALIGALVVFFGFMTAWELLQAVSFPEVSAFHYYQAAGGTGPHWVWQYLGETGFRVALVAVLILQFFWRNTQRSGIM